ncbi:hypothetical protein [Macrococcus capreoli]|uniref:hypothetical protein n=1 Tax=Macrococcus capreoli TaxID=2982690 RepID=UPI003EE7747C
MKQIYLYDENMLFVGSEIINETIIDTETETRSEYVLPRNATYTKPPDGLYKAKFDGENWFETITENELQKLNKNVSIISNAERLDALEGALIDLASSIL